MPKKVLSIISYAFLAQQSFLRLGEGWAEDALIGLILQLNHVEIKSLGPLESADTGYTSAAFTNAALYNLQQWDVFVARMAAL